MSSEGLTRARFLRSAAGLTLCAALPLPAAAQSPGGHPHEHPPHSLHPRSLPVIGCGTWIGFDVAPGSAEYQRLPGVLDALFAAGGTVLDSSPMYGRSEAVTGDLLAASKRARAKAFPRHQGLDQRPRGRHRADGAVLPAPAHRSHRPDAGAQPGRLAHPPRRRCAAGRTRPHALHRHHALHRLGLSPRSRRCCAPRSWTSCRSTIRSIVREAAPAPAAAGAERGVAVIVNHARRRRAAAPTARQAPAGGPPRSAARAGRRCRQVRAGAAVTCAIPGTSRPRSTWPTTPPPAGAVIPTPPSGGAREGRSLAQAREAQQHAR